jgi:hypothetical protein
MTLTRIYIAKLEVMLKIEKSYRVLLIVITPCYVTVSMPKLIRASVSD